MPKGRVGIVWVVLAAASMACQNEGPETEDFEASLTGGAERPVPRTTPATGSATLQLIGGTVGWTLTVNNITNVTAAHIHGPAGLEQDAPPIVTLVASGPLTGTRTGSFTQLDAGVTSVADLDALLQLMRNGQTYINVHTNDNVAPTNTGPGDFPGGEIRGQIFPR